MRTHFTKLGRTILRFGRNGRQLSVLGQTMFEKVKNKNEFCFLYNLTLLITPSTLYKENQSLSVYTLYSQCGVFFQFGFQFGKWFFLRVSKIFNVIVIIIII